MAAYQKPSTCLGGLGLRQTTALLVVIASVLLGPHCAIAQFAPSIGYMFPSGGQAGETVEVTLGGYDWTPDMQLFVRDERIKLEMTGEPGPVLVPEPPYWFGKKARRAPFALPRETKARLTIPAGTPPGVIKWQAANANGGTACGRFTVSDLPIQLDSSEQTQILQTLPFCVSGQIKLIREVDRFQFASVENCQVRCSLITASIASPLRAILQVRDTADRLIAEVADTAGADSTLTFAASAGQVYSAVVYDLDFRGDRSFVYQLTIAPEAPVAVAQVASNADQTRSLTVPALVSGMLSSKSGEDRFHVSGQAGEVWTIAASGEKAGSQVDPTVTVLDREGKLLARGDDTPGSTDAVLEFKVPAVGEYEIVVSDLSGSSGSPRATYEMSIQHTVPDFELRTVEKIDVPIGGKANLELNVVRKGGFTDPIDLKFIGLPTGIHAAENLQIPAKKNSLKVEVHADALAAATAALASVQGQAVIGEQVFHRSTDSVLVSSTIKPPFSIDAEGQDDVTKWPRGTTFPAPVLIARDPGFEGEILLEMTSMQGRHIQGITGPDLRVGPKVSRVLYPVFLPEWLETTRTSRMVVNGVAQVPDPLGNLRYSVSRQKTRMGFLPIGALLKITTEQSEIPVKAKSPLVIPVIVHRDASLVQPLTLTLVTDKHASSPFSAASQSYAHDISRCEFAIDVNPTQLTKPEYPLTIRATLTKDGQYPVVSETTVIVTQD